MALPACSCNLHCHLSLKRCALSILSSETSCQAQRPVQHLRINIHIRFTCCRDDSRFLRQCKLRHGKIPGPVAVAIPLNTKADTRSEEHTSELQSRENL